jgi:hypothetical protein
MDALRPPSHCQTEGDTNHVKTLQGLSTFRGLLKLKRFRFQSEHKDLLMSFNAQFLPRIARMCRDVSDDVAIEALRYLRKYGCTSPIFP